MLDGSSNVQLRCDLMKYYHKKLKVICEGDHNISLFFDDVTKTSIVIQMVGT